ncbi:EAL domain-containing protein [Arenimonas sp.]|uniref:EAL domain-containing protein n=1 Tax=Arenimonas sp. TaxID=1872635 RepID=UPI0035B13AB8
MNPHDESRLAAHRPAFLRHLPRRVEKIGRRLHHFLQDGWDINGLALLNEDALSLGHACREHGLDEAGRHFLELHELLHDTLQQQALPSPEAGERIWHLVEGIGQSVPMGAEAGADISTPPRVVQQSGRAETPPANYWRRWGEDAPDATATAMEEPAAAPAPTPAPAPAPRPAPTPASAKAPPPKPAPAPRPPVPAMSDSAPDVTGIRVYHLTEHGPLSLELDQRMEAAGYEVELLETPEELSELLGALPARLALVDAGFSNQLDEIGATVRAARELSSQPIQLVALSEADDINLRLNAKRAGVDLLLVEPNAGEVLKRIGQLVSPGGDQPFRVLIVEDDRSQALFAESILRNAGMQTEVVLDALDVLETLHRFAPDLILMDLHMPHANGIELTVLIRDQDPFLHTPIVFLSGEADTDRQFETLEAGGDDFISKPVRPRHLIAAVSNRVARHRASQAKASRRSGRHPETGLLHRTEVRELVAETLAAAHEASAGGVLFLEVESVNLLRDRLGLTLLEQLLAAVGKLVGEQAGARPATRFGDGSFVVVDVERDEAGLEAFAAQLRAALVQHPFNVQGHPLRLRVSVGVCAFRHRFTDVAELLDVAERMAREARTQDKGVRRYQPAQPTEAAREIALVTEIREAIARNSLELLYQPVVAVAGSDDSQYQVLLRLRDANGKLLPAAEVVPLAERGDFITDIDRWVLQAAMKLVRDRRAEGKALRLFVTQSPLTMADPGQATWLKAELAAHDVPGTSLVVELRMEDAAIHAGTIRAFCDAMVADGLQFCLSQFEPSDDTDRLFDELPLGFVKLARKYTSTALSPAMRDELKVLIDRAHRRGLEVIGHGVEDAQAAATLWMSGIDFIQGNLVQQADSGMDFDFQQAVL